MTAKSSKPLAKHLALKPPAVLYHYTSLDVLEKITRTGEIWASDVEFLNDSQEYIDAKEFIKQGLEVRVLTNEKLRSLVHSYVGQMYHEVDHLDTYITSFSAEGDSLPQWRGYCPNAQGVAIGFLPAALKAAEMQAGGEDRRDVRLELFKCVYSSVEKGKLLDAYFQHFIYLVEKHHGTDSMEPGMFLQHLTDVCCQFFKNASFREEMEWRLSVRCVYRDVPERHFHIGRSTVIPHLRLDVRKNYRPNFISEVVIGPTPDKNLSYMGVQTLLNRRELANVKVRHSDIPYRTW